ncbi:MAG: glycosyltransferase family 4 protein [Proteobacteria bacterium]|nr:glycosyltransferase family 4 protein [Pseudomonadota bacterium]
MLIVHPHFHHHHTGVSGHTLSVAAAQRAFAETWVVGPRFLPPTLRMGLLKACRRLLREGGIWHAHRNLEMLFGLCLRALSRLLGKKNLALAYTRHGFSPPSAWTRFLAKRAQLCVVLNEASASHFLFATHLVPHGIDLTRHAPPQNRQQSWTALGLGGRYGLGVVGRVRPSKGQGDFAKAMQPLWARYPEWQGLLLGLVKAEHTPWAKQLEESAHGKLPLLGEKPDVCPYYKGLSIVVHPSHGESFGLVVLEAMAAGCCVVVAKWPHIPKLIVQGKTGFWFEIGDVEGLRRILEELLQNPGRVEEVGCAAAAFAGACFSIEKEAKSLVDLYGATCEVEWGIHAEGGHERGGGTQAGGGAQGEDGAARQMRGE